jgi:hypothetical protein
MTEIRCCCTPENLIGHAPMMVGISAGLQLRELDDGTHAFSSDERDDIDQIPGFVRDNRKGGKKTWRKK